MASRPNNSQADMLESCRLAFENVETNPTISAAMTEYGYDATKITEGKEILTAAKASYDLNEQEDVETDVAYDAFKAKWNNLKKTFASHRKKTKLIFRKEPETLIRLRLVGSLSKKYLLWLESAKPFYSTLATDTDLQAKIARVKITPEELTQVSTDLADLETLRATYVREVGESEDATKQKNSAIDEIQDWMIDFYGFAEIALADHPQLLESLGRFVKS